MDRPAPLAHGFVERRAQPSAPRRRWNDAPPAAPLPATQVALTVKQVADLLGMTPKAVYHRAERGVPCCSVPGAVSRSHQEWEQHSDQAWDQDSSC